MKPYAVLDEDGIVHEVAIQENALQVGVLQCWNWYSTVGRSQRFQEAATRIARDCIEGSRVQEGPTCLFCVAPVEQ